MNGCGGMNLSPALVLVAASHQDGAPSFFVLPQLERLQFPEGVGTPSGNRWPPAASFSPELCVFDEWL